MEFKMSDNKAAREEILKIITDLYPDYQNFSAGDFSRLSDSVMRTITSSFAHKTSPEMLIPQSFIRQYGDDAAAEMMLAVERELARRGKTETYAAATLSGGLRNSLATIEQPAKNDDPINSNVTASITLVDNTKRTATAPKILNFVVAQEALALAAKNEAARKQGTYKPQTEFGVVVPQNLINAIVAANKQLPKQLADKTFGFGAGDELAYMSGYATRAGASREVGPVTMEYPPSAVCALPKITSQLFNPNKPDIDAALAWAAGYIQRDVDQMPETQRNTVLAACPAKAKGAAR
jgi:hypothetical protein